jgi:hypothetical protein
MNADTDRLQLRAEDLAEDRSSGAAGMWRRLDAALVYDSRQQTVVVGVRSATAGLPRLMYTARDVEIDVQVRPSANGGTVRLLGQVLNDEFEPCTGWVVADGVQGKVQVDLDDCGHFSIDGLTAGRQRLEVHLPNALIVVPPIHI